MTLGRLSWLYMRPFKGDATNRKSRCRWLFLRSVPDLGVWRPGISGPRYFRIPARRSHPRRWCRPQGGEIRPLLCPARESRSRKGHRPQGGSPLWGPPPSTGTGANLVAFVIHDGKIATRLTRAGGAFYAAQFRCSKSRPVPVLIAISPPHHHPAHPPFSLDIHGLAGLHLGEIGNAKMASLAKSTFFALFTTRRNGGAKPKCIF